MPNNSTIPDPLDHIAFRGLMFFSMCFLFLNNIFLSIVIHRKCIIDRYTKQQKKISWYELICEFLPLSSTHFHNNMRWYLEFNLNLVICFAYIFNDIPGIIAVYILLHFGTLYMIDIYTRPYILMDNSFIV